MKKYLFPLIVALAAVLVLIPACGNNNSRQTVLLKEISVSDYVSEISLSEAYGYTTEGLKVTGTFTDGSTRELTSTQYTVYDSLVREASETGSIPVVVMPNSETVPVESSDTYYPSAKFFVNVTDSVLTAAVPVIMVDETVISSGIRITITSATVGATIYYTTDGTEPNPYSTKYSGPFDLPAVTGTYTVKAYAVKEGYTDSPVAEWTKTYDDEENKTVATPVISVNYSTGEVTITSSEGSTIHYTMNGNEATEASSVYRENSKPIIQSMGITTISAMATKSGYGNSEVSTVHVRKISTPVIKVDDDGTVTITGETGAQIWYSMGTGSDAAYSESEKPKVTAVGATEITTYATAANCVSSDTVSKTATKLSTPVITVSPEISMAVISADDNATVYYTEDGTTPTSSGTRFSQYIELEAGAYSINAIAIRTGFVNSDIATAEGSFLPADKPAVVIDRNAVEGKIVVTMSSTTEDVQIAYVYEKAITDNPNGTSGEYTAPLEIPMEEGESFTIKAVAYREGYRVSDSETASVTYTRSSGKVATPSMTYFANQGWIMISAAEGTTIHYTDDGNDPTIASPVYDPENKPTIAEAGTRIYKAIAVRDGYMNSDVASLEVRKLETPVFTYADDWTVTMTAEEGATIYYELKTDVFPLLHTYDDNKKPNVSEGIHDVWASKPGCVSSNRVNVDDPEYAPTKVAMPVVPSLVAGDGIVPISCVTPGATIYWSLNDGPEEIYSDDNKPHITQEGYNIVKAWAKKEGMEDSAVAETYRAQKLPKPVVTVNWDTGEISMTCHGFSAASIHYTPEGGTPSPTSKNNIFKGSYRFVNGHSYTFVAIAVQDRQGYVYSDPSDPVSGTYYAPATAPTVTHTRVKNTDRMQVTIKSDCLEVYYTTDGSEPTQNSTKYEDPFEVGNNTTIRARAYNGHKVSEITSHEINETFKVGDVVTRDGYELVVFYAQPFTYDGVQYNAMAIPSHRIKNYTDDLHVLGDLKTSGIVNETGIGGGLKNSNYVVNNGSDNLFKYGKSSFTRDADGNRLWRYFEQFRNKNLSGVSDENKALWFVPSKDELSEIYSQYKAGNLKAVKYWPHTVDGALTHCYWSSSYSGSAKAWARDFNERTQFEQDTNIRKFDGHVWHFWRYNILYCRALR